MKVLIIGFGQDAKILSILLNKKKIYFKLFVKSSANLSLFSPKYFNKEDIIYGDATDLNSLLEVLSKYQFTHVFNLAANSFVQFSAMNFNQYLRSNTTILTNLISLNKKNGNFWLYHPLSSEFLNNNYTDNYILPRNAYGVSKVTEYFISKVAMREGIKIFFPTLFNHESCFRPGKFFTLKVLDFLLNKEKKNLDIWNTHSVRDWGSAFQYMELILEKAIKNGSGEGELGTSIGYKVSDFVNNSLEVLGINYEFIENKKHSSWKLSDGRKIHEIDRDPKDEKRIVIANKENVERTFGKVNLLHGKKLIDKLTSELITYKKMLFF